MTGPPVQVGDLKLDPATHRVERDGHHIRLTAKEFALLEYFMHNRGVSSPGRWRKTTSGVT